MSVFLFPKILSADRFCLLFILNIKTVIQPGRQHCHGNLRTVFPDPVLHSRCRRKDQITFIRKPFHISRDHGVFGKPDQLFSPHPCPVSYTHLDSINTIYSIKHKNGAIRRVNINIAATTVDNYRLLKEAGIGTYILFQETYHKESYLTLHPTGPKHDYNYHTEAMDRAMEGGVDDVGIGVLFGLDKYRYEFAGLLMHAEHLEAAFGVGPHTISVPRLRHADDILSLIHI